MKNKNLKKNINLSEYEKILQVKLSALVSKLGYDLLKLVFVCEHNTNYLRLTISHMDRLITLNDCEHVSKKVEEELDEKNLIPFQYILEVESPGENLNNSFNMNLDSFHIKGFGSLSKLGI